MKKRIFLIGALLALITATAMSATAPFPTWLDRITGDLTFTDDGTVSLDADVVGTGEIAALAVGGSEIAEAHLNAGTGALYGLKVAKFVFDTANGALAGSEYGMGVNLPAGAVVIGFYAKIITQFADSGSGTVAFYCEDANNLLVARDITGFSANQFIGGKGTAGIDDFSRGIAASCEIKAVVATATQTQGKLVGWVHYLVADDI